MVMFGGEPEHLIDGRIIQHTTSNNFSLAL